MTTPEVVGAGVVVHEFTDEALPVALTVKLIVPVGATEPVAPVRTAVNTRVELSAPVPLPVNTNDFNEAGTIVTGAAEVFESAV